MVRKKKAEERCANQEYLKTLCRSAYDLQKVRMQMGNRLRPGNAGKDEEDGGKFVPLELDDIAKETLTNHFKDIASVEKKYLSSISKELKLYPIYNKYLKDVRGCGPMMSGVIISELRDILRFATVSKLWAYCGYGLKDGKIQKLKSGEKANWNPFIKTKLHVLAGCFIKSKNPEYVKLFNDYKHRLVNQKGTVPISEEDKENEVDALGRTKGHRNAMAVRYMIKMFLKDLYFKWYEIEGVEPRPTYQEEYLGHKHNRS